MTPAVAAPPAANARIGALLAARGPGLFATAPLAVAARHLERIRDVVRAIESVIALPGWRAAALAGTPALAHDPGALGVFFGHDFHLCGERLGLVEINTNAGGALLNAELARRRGTGDADAFERSIVAMFHAEWARAGRRRPLARVVIVDDDPPSQHLYPEFLLFARLFERHGVRAAIADPAALRWHAGVLRHDGAPVDLVYNRLTDFALEAPAHAALREAWHAGAVVLTPHPRAHALAADKRLLARLGDPQWLASIGVPAPTRRLLAEHVLRTEAVDAADAARLWSARRGLFFKPRAGFGSRGAYRGDKLTRRAWNDVLRGDYVAQALLAPGEVADAAGGPPLKFDLRAYAYAGEVQWIAARLYRGQTTNFRTPGGGFAPVVAVD